VIEDPVLRRRARHVTTENERVDALASALAKGQLAYAGELLVASHASMRDDFDVTTPVLDELVGTVRGVPGVYGARVTGAGFGGCVIVLCRPKTRIGGPVVWRGRPAPGASLSTT
jgi:galactokinase